MLFLLVAVVACLLSLPDSLGTLLCTLPLWGIVAVPSGDMSRHRSLACCALAISLLPAIALACLVFCLLAYTSALSGRFCDEYPAVLMLGLLTLVVCSLPLAIATADARAQRDIRKQEVAP